MQSSIDEHFKRLAGMLEYREKKLLRGDVEEYAKTRIRQEIETLKFLGDQAKQHLTAKHFNV